jgi:hypothetical protein
MLYQQLPGLAPTTEASGDPDLVCIDASMNNIASAMHSDLAVRENRREQEHSDGQGEIR